MKKTKKKFKLIWSSKIFAKENRKSFISKTHKKCSVKLFVESSEKCDFKSKTWIWITLNCSFDRSKEFICLSIHFFFLSNQLMLIQVCGFTREAKVYSCIVQIRSNFVSFTSTLKSYVEMKRCQFSGKRLG